MASTAAPEVSPSSSATRPAVMPNEQTSIARFNRLKKLIKIQTWIIAGLGLTLFLFVPFAHPLYLYYALDPAKKVMPMTGLIMPNMTNRAVLSWSTISITEIMTMGFGDIDVRLPMQKIRFTSDGWASYMKSFVGGKIGQTFKQSQLVLTTVPSNTPIISAQGINPDGVYQWVVQMPVIMTYATNNNVQSQKHAVITLTIIRVPADKNPDGIAIQSWISN